MELLAVARSLADRLPVNELTDAQLALTQAQNTETQALSDYRIAIYQLDRARGRR